MNDVLPKPFTKEGLLAMLEKHLSHLKKGGTGIAEPMPPPLNSAKRSMKSEDSPATSPATASNWNSPSQFTGGSPPGSAIAEEPFIPGAQYAPPPMPATMYAPGPPGQLVMPPQAARRNIAEISGGPEMQDPKRQHLYTPGPMGQMAQPMAHIPRPPPPR